MIVPLMRFSLLPVLSLGATALLIGLAAAQTPAPATPTPAAPNPPPTPRIETIWKQSIDNQSGSGGLVLSSPVIYAGNADIIVAGSEPPPGAADPTAPARGWIERRGANGAQWRIEIDRLPPYPVYLEAAISSVDGAGRAFLALTFQTENPPPNGEYGRLLSIDLATGAVESSTPLHYPRVFAHGKPDNGDTLHVYGVQRLASGDILLFGGDGVGPYRWFAGLRKSDGSFVWDTGAPSRGYGEARSARETEQGFELLVDAIAYTRDYRDRRLLIKLNRAGRIVSTVDLGSLGTDQFQFADDGGLIAVRRIGTGIGTVWQLMSIDAQGNARMVEPALPDDARLIGQAGKWLAFDNDIGRQWFMSLDGERIGFGNGLAIPPGSEIVRFEIVDGRPVEWLLQQSCRRRSAEFDCIGYDLTLLRVTF